MTEIKPIEPLIGQIIYRVLGNYASTYNGNDIYYLVKYIYIQMNQLGEEFVKEEWEKRGHNWERTKKNLLKMDKKATEVKSFYDTIEDKRFDLKDKEKVIKKYYMETASKIPLISQEIYELFIFLVKLSSIQRQTIPPECFKILEHSKFKSLDMTRRPQNIGAFIPVGEFMSQTPQ